MNWFIFALLSGLGFAISRVISRALLKKQGDPLAFTAINDFIAGLVILPFIFVGFYFPHNSITWIYFLGIVVFAFLADWISFIALKNIDVSEYQIINQVRHIFILFGGLFIFSEAITTSKIVAVCLIILGVFVSLYEKNKVKINNGAYFTVLSTFFAIIAFIFAKLTVRDFSATITTAFEFVLIGLISFGFLGFRPKKILNELKIQKWGLIISGIIYGFFELLLFYALKTGDASKVVPVTQVSMIFTLLLGIFFLKERDRLTQKIIGIIIISSGIALIYLF